MGIFDLFKKKEALTAEQKLNKLWDAWAEGKAASPYAQLMTYESEVGNGGHSQYFFNVANTGDLRAEVETILPVLPELLKANLLRGYEAFSAQEDIADDANDDLFSECDDVFYEHEQLLIELLQSYANDLY
nr:hypothetical protein [Clostridia bacterium]